MLHPILTELKIEWKESVIASDAGDLIARLSSRVFLGEELGHNEAWLRLTKDYAMVSFDAAISTTACPKAFKFLLPLFSKKCKNVLSIFQEARALITPVIERRHQLKAEARRKGEPVPIYDDAIDWAENESQGSPYDPMDFQLFLSFTAIHTTSRLLSQTLMRLSSDQHLLALLRQEIVEVFKAHGVTKAAINELKLMDSALKENQRVKPDSDRKSLSHTY